MKKGKSLYAPACYLEALFLKSNNNTKVIPPGRTRKLLQLNIVKFKLEKDQKSDMNSPKQDKIMELVSILHDIGCFIL